MNRLHVTLAALIAVYSTAPFGQVPSPGARSQELSAWTSEQLRASYLECDRVTSRQSVAPEYMNACAEIGVVLMHRDFGGDFQRQIDWWKHARSVAAASDDEALAAPRIQP